MYAARFEFGTFRTCDDTVDGVLAMRAVQHMCEMQYRINCDLFSAYGHMLPRLYAAGILYGTIEADGGGDVWQDVITLNKRKRGDCGTLATYLAAERTVLDGILTYPLVKRKWPSCDFALYHVVTINHLTGEEEDPSLMLGMPSGAGV